MSKTKETTLPSNEAIRVFLRVKPNLSPNAVDYDIEHDGHFKGVKHVGNANTVKFHAPPEFVEKHTYIPTYKFAFDQIFDQPTEQHEIYHEVAKPVVDQALEGFNGTIFAYGQTATGKTYTILGPPELDLESKVKEAIKREKQELVRTRNAKKKEKGETSLEKTKIEDEKSKEGENEEAVEILAESQPALKDAEAAEKQKESDSVSLQSAMHVSPEAGIILRTLSHVFAFLDSQQDQRSVEISYLEIYNNVGYDLLSGKGGPGKVKKLNDLSRVSAMTDARQKLHLRNLSLHTTRSIEHAMELLSIGNATRKVAETHLNEASSRSHCVFTIHVAYKRLKDASVIRSKINLVDLAGSERVSKWGKANKTLLTETRNINLSLHHLQRVIEALSNKQLANPEFKRHYQHVPFRSSLITLVLSDSLGGNSVTRMVATVSNDLENLDETISTCRFAQRVASIHNKVISNQSADSDLVMARLKKEIAELKRSIEESSSPTGSATSTDFEKNELERLVLEYLNATDDQSILDVGLQRDVVQFCYKRMKQQVWLERRETPSSNKKSKACVIL